MSNRAINLKKNLIKSLGSKYLTYVFQVVSLIFYARFFSPETQGVIALLLAVNIFFITVSEGTITTSLITRNTLSTKQINGVFTFSILVAFVSTIISYFICEFFLSFSNINYDVGIVYFMSIGVFFNIILTVPKSLLYLNSKYYFISVSLIISELITLGLIYFTYSEDSALLLSLKFLTIPLCTFIFFYIYCYKISGVAYSISKDFSGVSSIIDFMKNSFGFNCLNYFSRNLDNLLMVKFFDAFTLGVYEKSYSLMKYPIQLLTSAVSPAIQPSLALNGFDVGFANKCYNIIFDNLIYIGFIISIFIQLNSEIIVEIILGETWIDVAPIISILSISLPIQIVTSFNGGFWNSADKSNLQFRVSLVNFFIFIPILSASFFYFDKMMDIVFVISFLLIVTCSYACVQIRKKLFNISRLETSLKLLCRYLFFIFISYLVLTYVKAGFLNLFISIILFSCLFLFGLYRINLGLKRLRG
jgi:O-antigen/teichoic acid export membrane protein